MRRSSKPTHLITQPGQDQTYRFRCMQYLNFVLDQVVNQQNRFKLYSSHIEHLLRNNLNDITIQDIEKIKRMIDEGEKQKIQTQQTGDFINYDLIDKMKYSHYHTHYYLQQAPQLSLLKYYGPNDHTIHEVQSIKNILRQQKLQENNYKMLDLMFKLPQDYQNLQNQIQKQIQNQQEHSLQIIRQQNQKAKTQQQNGIANNKILNKQNNFQNDIQEIARVNEQQKPIVVNQVDNMIQQTRNEAAQNRNQNVIIFSTPEKQNNNLPISEGFLDIPFVQIKKKKSNKKKLPLQQKPINSPVDNQIKPQKLILKQDKNQQHASLVQNDQDGNILTTSPQKRKYIRKKPLQQKKAKSDISKSGQKQFSNRESQLFDKKLQLQGEVRQNDQKQIVNIKKHSQQKQKRPRKFKKVDALVKKPSCVQEIQIMLPYPQCQQQVKQLKKQIQQLNKRLQNEKQQFLQNRQHVLNLLTKIKSGQQEQVVEHQANKQLGQIDKENNNFIKRTDDGSCKKKENVVDMVQMKENNFNTHMQHQQKEETKVHNQSKKQINNNNDQLIMTQLLPQGQHQLQKTKKHKTAWKPSVLKKQSKKSSSEQYQPPQDEIQSVYEVEKDGKLMLIDESSDKKKSKKQRKKDNKKIRGIKKSMSKSNQQCLVIQTGANKIQPSQQIINVSNNSIINDKNNNDSNRPHNTTARPLQIASLNPSPLDQMEVALSSGKQKKTKLTVQQRQRIKQQKQKLKQMRLREKQEKKKLKQLQKLQKQTLKLTHKLSEKSSAKQHKPLSTTKKPITNISNIKAINQQQKQEIQVKIDNKIESNTAKHNNNKQQELIRVQQKQKKNILDQSIGMNSTKENIAMDCSLISAEKQRIKQKDQLYVRSQSLEFFGIVELQQQQRSAGLKRQHPIQNQEQINRVSEPDIVEDNPRKKIKLVEYKESKQSQRGMLSPQYPVQIFHINSPSSPQPIAQQFPSPIERSQQQ